VLVLDRRVLTAPTSKALADLAVRHDITLEDTVAEQLNLDGLEQVLKLPASDEICAQLLEAWNLYSDIARSLDAGLQDSDADM
jgi:hypothetical protein